MQSLPLFLRSVTRRSALALALMLGACSGVTNNPHPAGSERTNTLFAPFTERSPKYLDPVSSYSNDETPYTYQIYEPLYGYHYLKRPYELVGRAAEEVARPRYLDAQGNVLPDDAPGSRIAETVFDVKLRRGIQFAPHPAFARDAAGRHLYHAMTREEVADKYKITDFEHTGSRELVADDYVYAIRRLATPRVKSPSFSTMSDYIVGLKEYGERIVEADKRLRAHLVPTDRDLPFLDFREHPFEGAVALDPHTVRIRVKGKYPQFKYWLAMTFFAPVPWEAEQFYSQPGMAEKNLTLNYWPVGTGPYMLTEFVENRRHVMERNPHFRGEPYPCEGEPGDAAKGYLADCGKMTPFVDKLVFTIEKEAVPLQTKFLQGYYDSPAIERLDYRNRSSCMPPTTCARSASTAKSALRCRPRSKPTAGTWVLTGSIRSSAKATRRSSKCATASYGRRFRLRSTGRNTSQSSSAARALPRMVRCRRRCSATEMTVHRRSTRSCMRKPLTVVRSAAASNKPRNCWPRRGIRTAVRRKPAGRWC
jgi:ABC-type transport system substrate-binding protein